MTYVKTEVKPQYGGYSILLTFKEDLVLPEVPAITPDDFLKMFQ